MERVKVRLMKEKSFGALRMATIAKAALAALLIAAPAANAEQVKLTSIDTGFVLTGELLEYTDGNFVIRSSIGQLTIDSRQVRCEGDGCPGAGPVFSSSIGVFGSNMIGSALMPGLIEAYSETQNSIVERQIGADATQVVMRLLADDGSEITAIELRSDSSANAFPGLISGAAAIGMSSRPVTDREVAALQQAGFNNINAAGQEHILALDGLIAIVSRDNALRTITTADLTDIFSGAVDNWAALGGPDAPINVYMREPGSGAYESFTSLVLESQGERLTSGAQFIQSSRALSDAVAADPNAIGVTGIAFERNSRALALETSCGLVIEPTEFNVKTEEYPLARRLFLYTTGASLAPSAQGLLEFALSDAAQGQIADLGFVNQEITSIPLNSQGRRVAEAFIQPRDQESIRTMRELALELLDAERLSTTLRFQPSSSVLDVKSRGDIERLARYIADGALDQKEIVLIGFADDVNRFEANMALSEQRAAQIRAEVEAELARIGQSDRVSIVTMGYGQLAPVACNDDVLGQASNRRVEVWVRDQF